MQLIDLVTARQAQALQSASILLFQLCRFQDRAAHCRRFIAGISPCNLRGKAVQKRDLQHRTQVAEVGSGAKCALSGARHRKPSVLANALSGTVGSVLAEEKCSLESA